MGLGAWPRYVVALIPLAIGAHALGWIRLPAPSINAGSRRGVLGAFIAGLLFSLVLAPCGTPVLASVLSYAALKGSAAYGGLLLFAYGLGAGVPILIAGTAVARLAGWLDAAGARRWVDCGTGALAIGVGFYLLITA